MHHLGSPVFIIVFLWIKSLVLPAVMFACKQESGEYNYGQICQMEGEGELCMCLCVD